MLAGRQGLTGVHSWQDAEPLVYMESELLFVAGNLAVLRD